MLEGIDLTSPNILLSGGAEGADTAFGKTAGLKGHQVVHWTFDGHKSRLRKNLYKLTDAHLRQADGYMVRASKGLQRYLPNKDYVKNLLRRNFYQVRWSESVYAVGRFGHGDAMLGDNGKYTQYDSMLNIDGGTAWGCQMYVDRFIYDQEPMKLCKLYFYDMTQNKWFQWNKLWGTIDCPPSPTGIYAGIGSRDITEKGITAISNLYNQ